MKLHHIRNIIAIVERGSLRAAAKHLGLAQPAMSRSITELEQELGVILFTRNKFGMTLTPVGEVFVRRARAMQAELQRTFDEIAQFKGLGRGSVSIGCSAAATMALLPALVPRFRRRFPDVRLRVLEGTLPMLETEVRDGLIDLFYGPVVSGFTDPSLSIERLFDNGRIIAGRRGHPLRNATSLAELADAHWLTTPVAVDCDNEVNCMFEAAGLPRPHIAMQAMSGLSVTTIIANSDLLAPLPMQWLDVIQATNLLVRIPVRQVPLTAPVCSVRRANMPLTPAANFLNDLAIQAAKAYAHTHPLNVQ